MKRLWGIILLLALAGALRAETIVYQKFGGLNVDDSPLTVEGKSPDSENVITDVGPSLTGRYGFVSFSTSTCPGGLWEFPNSNGTRYLVCGDTGILKATTGGGTFNITVSTIASGVSTVGSVLGNAFYFANTTDGLKSWDGTTTSVANATMKVSMLVTHKGCLWAAGMASAPRTIYKSAFGNGANWTLATDPVVTDPAQFVIGGAVDEPLTAIYASFQDKLMWFKSHSFGGILGSDRNDFNVRTYSDRVGTAYAESVKDCDGTLRWLGGSRTVWEFTGSALVKISRGIEDILSGVVQGDANARAYEITSKTDFDAGTIAGLSTAISPGDIMLSSFTLTGVDTSSVDFASGTLTNVTTSTVNGALYLISTATSLFDNSFESGTGWTGDYTLESDLGVDGSLAAYVAAFAETVGLTISVYDYSTGNTTVLDSFTPASPIGWTQRAASSMSAFSGRTCKLILTASGDSLTRNITSVPFFCSGGTVGFYYRLPQANDSDLYLDLVYGTIRSTVTSGQFTSRTFDVGIDSAGANFAWTPTGANWTANSHTINAYTQSSADGVTWDSTVTWSTGSAPTSAFNRYIRYKIDISTASAGTGMPYVSDVSLSAIARPSTGSYVSTSFSLGTPSGFGVFVADGANNGGSLSYTLYTDTDSTKTIVNGVPVAGSYLSSQTVTSETIPTVSTGAYAFFGSTFVITAATQNPTLSSLILNWTEGSTLKTAAAYTNQRYWLGCAINSTTNNRVLVYDRNKEWQRYSGINATSMTPYNGNLYFSNTSGVFQGETGYTDNGAAISSYYQTHTLAPASSHLVSNFNDLMMTMDNSPTTLSTTYQVNGVSTDYNLVDYAMNTQSGIQDIRFPFPFSQVQQGKNVSFKWAVSGTSFWRILGATFDFTPDRVSQ